MPIVVLIVTCKHIIIVMFGDYIHVYVYTLYLYLTIIYYALGASRNIRPATVYTTSYYVDITSQRQLLL